ncbi:MAG: transglycosylase domain-containing protein, partial [Rhizobacter sp.]
MSPSNPEPPQSTPFWTPRRARLTAGFCLAAGVVAIAAATSYITMLVRTSPGAYDLKQVTSARPSVLMSADGETLATFSRGPVQRVTVDDVSPHLIDALLATEDHRFHEHSGVDLKRLVGALYYTCTGRMQGGSTLTQQLARNLFPEEIGRARSLHRKLKELITALRIEAHYSKQQILEAYLNSAPFLYNVVGIEMAARTYFDKPAAELDTLQAATLVGMLKGTAYYNPVRHPQRAQERRNVVLGQMARHGHLTAARLAELQARPLAVRLRHQPENEGNAPHFVGYVRKWLLEWAETHDVDFYADGLVIETTLDSRLQDAA